MVVNTFFLSNRLKPLFLSYVSIFVFHVFAYNDAAKKTTQSPWPSRAGCASSADTAIGLKKIIFNIYSSYYDIYVLVSVLLFLSGVLFVIFGFFKLKQFRDNPQQVTVGMPITYLFIGVGLIFIPQLIVNVRNTIFDTHNSTSLSPIPRKLTQTLEQIPGNRPSCSASQ